MTLARASAAPGEPAVVRPVTRSPAILVLLVAAQETNLLETRADRLAIPGIGPLVAAGPIVALLTGVGVLGAAGGVLGALIGLGIPEYEAKRYEGRIRAGGILLSVHCDDPHWSRRAKDILERTGAEDVASTGEANADFAKSSKPPPRTRRAGDL